ncbi:hypothetical protein JX265_009300 [Neoarthrinium moseri]|uniref:NAD-dependent epimerase/dehydratase domain-containing protein n=1 Tax=Neoarthrinium moseri TaxID=1658444 RepID=A0A9P9WGA8_9PEZI|nr:hypothetical protein JX265_009300 [Neoarthrinium moseri]
MSSYVQKKLASGSKLHIFVTGATGYIGHVFAEKAIAAGHSVSGLSRTESGDAVLRALGATSVRGDLTSLDVLARESTKADAVVHLAWVHDFAADLQKIADGDIAATDAMMEGLAGTGKPIVTASGCGGYEPTADGSPATEETPKRKGTPFMDARKRSEDNVLNRTDVHGVVIRLSPYVYGRGGRGFLMLSMSQALKYGESLYIGEGDNVTSTLHVDDAADLYLSAIQYAGQGQLYNGVSSSETTLRQMAEAVGEVMEVPVRSISFGEAAEKWGEFLAFFNALETKVSFEKAKQQLHWLPKGVPFLEDIVRGSYRDVAAQMKAEGKKNLPAIYGFGKEDGRV